MFIVGQMYSLDPGAEPQTYTYNVPEEIRRFIHFFHQHVTEQVFTNNVSTPAPVKVKTMNTCTTYEHWTYLSTFFGGFRMRALCVMQRTIYSNIKVPMTFYLRF